MGSWEWEGPLPPSKGPPINRQNQVTVGRGCFFDRFHGLSLLLVAFEMRKLKIIQVRGVAAFCDWDDMVHGRTHRVWKFQFEVHRSPANRAAVLGCQDDLLIAFILEAVWTVMVRSISLWSHRVGV